MTRKILAAACAAAAAAAAFGANQASSTGENALSAGARYHVNHSVFTDIPFGNADISYFLGYEFSEGAAAFRLALDYAPDVSGQRGTNTTQQVGTDYVLTPQAHLLFKDSWLRGGGGALISYIRDDDGNGDWSDIYGQLQLGIHVPPTARLTLDIAAFYIFAKFQDFKEFDFKDLEYGAWVTYKF